MTKAIGIPISVLSANFRAIVTSCLKNLHTDNLVSITGLSSNDITATDKETTTAQHILKNPELAVFLYIDGLSDNGCLQGIVAGATAAPVLLKQLDKPVNLTLNLLIFIMLTEFSLKFSKGRKN